MFLVRVEDAGTDPIDPHGPTGPINPGPSFTAAMHGLFAAFAEFYGAASANDPANAATYAALADAHRAAADNTSN